ncbi:8-oxo-dGTP pyrophosphatase MutT (NUDIX family) [Roseimicrobium gellanilyticum]|uniref:8-oxo-dGTP pyrophosphatase MutT (NUDIX family) n=1 Tax=Roseimicrobium gellanilyticum TaxID=748857 RepID=A0A366HU08_9BACT|nr:NUDIX hydrolase [Roseimicrobium gellanilyticum]RBP46413.1 8-oxo-dGTP pyrophosphatase MutT (NUDIX family) [Roseimicrobium gellanilyticum]
MKHRIRAAALVVQEDSILLVQHVYPDTGESFWVPPGGGMEDVDDSIFGCATREVFEETGITVTLSRIAYIREFSEPATDTMHMEIFLYAESAEGSVTIEHLPPGQPDSDMIKESRFVRREELAALTVYPAELKDVFWEHHAKGFPETHYLGRTH